MKRSTYLMVFCLTFALETAGGQKASGINQFSIGLQIEVGHSMARNNAKENVFTRPRLY
jgi:hypothetical protein